jgi:hypothetical protein
MEIGGGQDQGFGGSESGSGPGGGRAEEREQARDEPGESGRTTIPDPGEKDQPAEGGMDEATDGAGRS